MIDADDFGPAMSALTEQQRGFVIAMVTIPGCSFRRAALEAGYSDASEAAKVSGHRCAHNPAVQAAIREEAGKRLNSLSVVAANVMMDLMLDGEVDAKTKLKAAAAVLDRTGFGAAQTINVNKTTTDRTGAGMLERIRALAAANGLDPVKLLGGNAPAVVDAEFSEVKE
jgi:phage terminase small subunit